MNAGCHAANKENSFCIKTISFAKQWQAGAATFYIYVVCSPAGCLMEQTCRTPVQVGEKQIIKYTRRRQQQNNCA